MGTPTDAWGTSLYRQEATNSGLILVDGTGRLLYYDAEAIAVLSYPRHTKSLPRVEHFLLGEVQALLLRLSASHATRGTIEFTSGRRRYVCRAFALTGNSGTNSRQTTGLLIERDAPKMVNVSGLTEHFHLTQRERETVTLLLEGLSDKEIANQLTISPNTVRAFLRLVMSKMQVSSRAAILAKILSIVWPDKSGL